MKAKKEAAVRLLPMFWSNHSKSNKMNKLYTMPQSGQIKHLSSIWNAEVKQEEIAGD